MLDWTDYVSFLIILGIVGTLILAAIARGPPV